MFLKIDQQLERCRRVIRPTGASAHPSGAPSSGRRGVRHPRRADADRRILRTAGPRRDPVRAVRDGVAVGHHLGHHLVQALRAGARGQARRPPAGTVDRPGLVRPLLRRPHRRPGLPRRRHRHQGRAPAQPLDPADRRGRRRTGRAGCRGAFHRLPGGRLQPAAAGRAAVHRDRTGRPCHRPPRRTVHLPRRRSDRIRRALRALLDRSGRGRYGHGRDRQGLAAVLAAGQGPAAVAEPLRRAGLRFGGAGPRRIGRRAFPPRQRLRHGHQRHRPCAHRLRLAVAGARDPPQGGPHRGQRPGADGRRSGVQVRDAAPPSSTPGSNRTIRTSSPG